MSLLLALHLLQTISCPGVFNLLADAFGEAFIPEPVDASGLALLTTMAPGLSSCQLPLLGRLLDSGLCRASALNRATKTELAWEEFGKE